MPFGVAALGKMDDSVINMHSWPKTTVYIQISMTAWVPSCADLLFFLQIGSRVLQTTLPTQPHFYSGGVWANAEFCSFKPKHIPETRLKRSKMDSLRPYHLNPIYRLDFQVLGRLLFTSPAPVKFQPAEAIMPAQRELFFRLDLRQLNWLAARG